MCFIKLKVFNFFIFTAKYRRSSLHKMVEITHILIFKTCLFFQQNVANTYLKENPLLIVGPQGSLFLQSRPVNIAKSKIGGRHQYCFIEAIVRGRSLNITLINVHAQTEEKDQIVKNIFYVALRSTNAMLGNQVMMLKYSLVYLMPWWVHRSCFVRV